MHLHIHVDPGNNGENHSDAQHDSVNRVVFGLSNEEGSEIDDNDLFRESEEGCDCEMPEFDVAGGKYGRGEMWWNDRETDNEDDLNESQ